MFFVLLFFEILTGVKKQHSFGMIYKFSTKETYFYFPKMFEFIKGIMWDKVFKNGPSEFCERQPLKNWSVMVAFFEGYLPQISCGPFLNTLSHLQLYLVGGIRQNFENKYIS